MLFHQLNSTATPTIGSMEPVDWTEKAALDGLRTLLDQPEATWTSTLQRDSVMTVLNTQQDVLAILTTSSGKSMLSLIPALLEHHLVTVLILPLKSLITDYKRKLDKMHLPYLHYTGQHVPRGYCTPNLVLVSVDLAREQHWKQWIAEINTIKPVRRFCFDEGHYPLTDANFRESVRDIYMIRSLPCQLVVYSGTIAPKCEPTLKEMFMFHPNVKIIRSPSTNRPEFQLIKGDLQSTSSILEVVHHLWTEHARTFTANERALIFVPFIELGRHLSTMLHCEFYNSRDADDITESVYTRWREGTHKVMVSTSAFSCGNDYAHIPLIIHAGTPREMIGYIQEISRGGRDKKHTFCYLLPISKWSSASSTELDDLLGVKEMAEICFGSNSHCLRYAITKYNDGQGVYCGENPNDLRCSSCLPTAGFLPSAPVPSLKRKTMTSDLAPIKSNKIIKLDPLPEAPMSDSMKETWARIKAAERAISAEEDAVFSNVQNNLNMLLGECAACFWMEQHTSSVYQEERHEFKKCRFHQSASGADYIRFKSRIHYDTRIHRKICFICHVPNFGDKLHTTFGGPSSCQYLDIILPTLYCGYVNKKEALEKEFGLKWWGIEQYAHWLGGKLVKPKERSNLISAYLVICNKLM